MPGSWEDLRTRLASGAALAVLGVVMIGLGGPWFAGLAAAVVGVMIWELTRMTAPDNRAAAVQLGMLAASAVLLARALPGIYVLPVLLAPVLVGAGQIGRNRALFVGFAAAILLAGYALSLFRDSYGMAWLAWLVLVVIATDVAGYFAGRFIGGPKFWPRVSPKKTWSGTLGGWLAALCVGLIFAAFTGAGAGAGVGLAAFSVLLSVASQVGDLSESALKRRMGVKDSSALLPGHGGLCDRFDGLMGAALFMLLVAQLIYIPEVRF
ncbi:phosphatidate cytidylyltransferase [Rhodovulum adriaticum]|uniref:Phosphatidate cytidylyltransferase n=1 Tax=Rhodovulum adriaticum TaxID=35804 RepID=A0A4R2NTU4_RHOAD|nr:phosphatidate cytidylyltransferase [Rhodovulum adriaticum]MBK1635074.1 phosphatidate cytidylyltransferase [Rhodovulum adriaticum]TCP25292.1 phosphatidate cytidylyltransferase [Rhodovulum adriaticum]